MLPIGRPIDAVVGPWTYWFCLAPLGGFLLFLALLPTDARAIRAVCAALVAACLVLGSLYLVLGALAVVHPQPGTLVWAVGGWLPMGLLLLAAAAALAPPALPCDGGRHVRVMQPRLALQRLWLVARLFYLGTALLKFSFYSTRLVFHPARRSDPIVIGHLACGGVFLLCAVLATSANRGRVHRWLGRCGGRGGAEDEAVAVAALVGGADPAKALQGAAALFRCLRASALETSDLSASALASTESARTLASKTVRAKLGEVTAFVSHSWCDEKQAPGAKFRAVQRWARAQWTAGGQEPTLWLCKACLHADIEQSLASLPVFLAGCQQLLIVAGPTYSTRLWCVTEVVTFLHMGGELERIEILPLLSSAAGGQAEKRDGLDRLTAQFATFDAAKAQCALAKDRQRLLAAIEAGFGDFKEFNKRVRGVLAARATALQGSQSVGDLRI